VFGVSGLAGSIPDRGTPGETQVWRDVRFPSGETRSLVCVGDRVAYHHVDDRGDTPVGTSSTGISVWQADGWTVLPRLGDGHVHPDKSLWGSPWRAHEPSGDILTRVAAEQAVLLQADPTAVRAERLLTQLVQNGTTAARCHVDVSAGLGVTRLEPVLDLREKWRGTIDLQLVAFPQEGIVRAPGTASAMRDAVQAGCDVVGGLDPQVIDADRDAHLSAVIALAAEYGAQVDVHLHEPGAEGAETMLLLAQMAEEAGMRNNVAISHAFALADLWSGDKQTFEIVAEVLARGGITIVTSLPGEGLCPPVAELIGRGVPVVVASDNIRDCWSPFGRGDALERAYLAAYLNGWRTDEQLASALDLVSRAPSKLMGLSASELAEGDPADFTLVKARSLPEAIMDQPRERIVVRGGRVVAGREHLVAAQS
jgi:cytosine deaminase